MKSANDNPKRTGRRRRGALIFPPLKFVRSQPGRTHPRRDYWAVEPTGQYMVDCDTGAAMAQDYLEYLVEGGNSGWTILPDTVREIIARGDNSGLFVGFMGTIGQALAASMLRSPEVASFIADRHRAGQRQLVDELRNRKKKGDRYEN